MDDKTSSIPLQHFPRRIRGGDDDRNGAAAITAGDEDDIGDLSHIDDCNVEELILFVSRF